MKTEKEHDLEMQLTKLLIDSGFPLNQQKRILKRILFKIDFCQKTGAEINQQKLF
jgi:hypothetical protein